MDNFWLRICLDDVDLTTATNTVTDVCIVRKEREAVDLWTAPLLRGFVLFSLALHTTRSTRLARLPSSYKQYYHTILPP